MRKNAQLVIRVPADFKSELEKVAAEEARSTAQIAEAFLRAGLETYRKQGGKIIQKFLGREIG